MQPVHKLAIASIVLAFVALIAIVSSNVYNTRERATAYRDCVAANKVIAETLAKAVADNTFRTYSFPSCDIR